MLWKYLLVVLVAMVPVIDLRGAIPIGMGMGLDFWPVFICSFIGNILPVPIIILFVRKVFAWMRKISPKLDTIVTKIENKALAKSETVKKYQLLGLFIFVAIPLPGTGAWTGALIAALLDMRLKSAFPAISLGVLVAGIIISIVSYGAFSLFT